MVVVGSGTEEEIVCGHHIVCRRRCSYRRCRFIGEAFTIMQAAVVVDFCKGRLFVQLSG